MPIFIIVLGVLLLLFLMVQLKVNAFLSLILTSLVVGVLEGMSLNKTIASIESGLGSTLGSLALVLGFGAMLGKLMEDSGAAQRIAEVLTQKFGQKHIQWAALITAFIVGLAMFYETGFVILIPLVFSIALEAQVPILYIGVPVATALITMHGLVPPHPGPVTIANIFHANLGITMIIGITIAIPAILIGGLLFSRLLPKDKLETQIPEKLFKPTHFTDEQMPSFTVSIMTAVIPVILMAFYALCEMFWAQSSLMPYMKFIGNPAIALLIAVLVAIFTFGLRRGKSMKTVMDSIADSISSIAMILLIIGGGGAFKQVLVDSHVDTFIAGYMNHLSLSPLLIAWLLAAVLRLSLGSATVAGMTAAGIVAPLIAMEHVSPELMVLAIGAGSITFSHVNDAGFWIYKEYFNLSIGRTLQTWSVLTLIVSIIGLLGVLVWNLIL